jgi:hypothetical protein
VFLREVVIFWKEIWKFFVVTLEHGTYLHLVLQLVNMLLSNSYQSYESLYSFGSPKECPSYHRTMFWTISQSRQCCQVFFCVSQCSREVLTQVNHSSVLPSFILVSICHHLIHHLTSLSYVSFVSMMGETSWPSFDEFVPIHSNTLPRN